MSNPYVGEIRIFAGNFAPQGWAFCNGQLMAITDNEVLFVLIGTTYGGDGQNTFALPNLQSRVPLHQSSSYPLGAVGGAEAVTLTLAQLPSHTHTAMGAATGTANTPAGNVWAGTSALGQFATGTAANETMNGGTVAQSGNSLPHDNMIPYLALNFIISLFGIFPSQS